MKKFLFSVLLLCMALATEAQFVRRAADTLLVQPSGPGTQAYAISAGGDTLFLKNFPVLTASATLNFANTPGRATSSLTVPVADAAEGDAVAVGAAPSATLPGIFYSARVSAPGVVTVTLFNTNTNPKNPGEGVFKIRVLK